MTERITVRQNSRTTDTPENRFVKFALRSFRQFLAEMRNKPALQSDRHERLRTELCHYQALEAADQLQQMLDERAEQELAEAWCEL